MADPDNPIWDNSRFVREGHVQPVQVTPRQAPKSLLKQKQIEIDDLQGQVALMQVAIDDNQEGLRLAYRERARLVAFLASIYPCHIGYTDPNQPEWPVVMVYTPAGQMSWHISRDDSDLFDWVVEMKPGDYDGHTTEEKYRRLEQLAEWAREDLEKALGTE